MSETCWSIFFPRPFQGRSDFFALPWASLRPRLFTVCPSGKNYRHLSLVHSMTVNCGCLSTSLKSAIHATLNQSDAANIPLRRAYPFQARDPGTVEHVQSRTFLFHPEYPQKDLFLYPAS